MRFHRQVRKLAVVFEDVSYWRHAPQAFLHERLRAAHVARLPAVPCVDRAGVDAADVRREEHVPSAIGGRAEVLDTIKRSLRFSSLSM